MEKRTYYVSLTQGEIARVRTEESMFVIRATDEEIHYLRTLFQHMYDDDRSSYWRAHIPFLEYHYDEENDRYDEALGRAYAHIYQLGNEETKKHIEGMNILQRE
ncbi:hydrolase [Priestia taiwanensis]|uniref:Hydrolase n=1 Tax=Priestia taiwanensis TaxID=1347902 RepID=A0A917ERX4_9BACI|nr:hydrolase [Priestia taiwanensis]MBM7363337.1 hypothetical protein [Priestia taiwanensis]GGE77970.1 hypothetical protein GCM10007140_29550 [Priestia taiwanensis]